MVAEDAEPGEAAFVSELRDVLSPMAARATRCPTPDVLRAVQEDVLPPHVAAVVRRHVETCPMCRTLASDLVQIELDAPGDLERGRIHARLVGEQNRRAIRRRPLQRAWWIGAAAAMAASVAFALYLPDAGPLPAVHSAPPIATAAVSRPTLLAVDKPTLRLPVATLVSLRGGGGVSGDVVQGLARYRADDFRGAAEHLARVVPNQSMPQLAMYLGVSYLQIGDASRAVQALTAARVTASSDLSSDLDWYLAVAHARIGDVGRAREELASLCESGTEVALKACLASAELKR